MKWIAAAGLVIACDGSSGSGVTVTIEAPRAPQAVIAYRAGDGAWTTASGAMAPLSFRASERYSVAVACPQVMPTAEVTAYEATVDELAAIEYDRECRAPAATLSGAITGGSEFGLLAAWGSHAFAATFDVPTYSMMVPAGTHDLVVTRGFEFATHLLVVRDLEIAGDFTQDVAFAGATPLQPSPVFVAGTSQLFRLVTEFVTADGTSVEIGVGTTSATAVPEAARLPDDLHIFTAADQVGAGPGSPVISTRHVSRVPPTSLELPAPIATQPSVLFDTGGSTLLARAMWPALPGASSYRFSIANWTLHVTPAAFENDIGMSIPDLSGVAGWEVAFGIPPGPTSWRIVAVTGAPLEDTLLSIPTREHEIRSSGWAASQ